MSSAKKQVKGRLALRRSAFVGRPPVLAFDFEASPHDESTLLTEEELLELGITSLPKMYFALETTKDVHEYRAVVNTLTRGGLYKISHELVHKWAVYWGPQPTPDMLRGFNPYQKANHFPHTLQLARKDLLWRNVNRLRKQHPNEFDIMPLTFLLPEEFQLWELAREQQPKALWIWKPVYDACGRGIKLYDSKLDPQVAKKLSGKAGVVQKYIDDPMLIEDYKFDLRVYVVVTSFDPLKVYFNPEGLVRIATEKYKPAADNLNHVTMHLTNYSINKHASGYVSNKDEKHRCIDEGPVSAGTGRENRNAEEDVEGEVDDVEEEDVQGAAAGEDGDDDEEEQFHEDPKNVDDTGSAMSSKWSFAELREYFQKTGRDYEQAMAAVKDVVVKTLISVESTVASMWQQGSTCISLGEAAQVGPNQTCFEVFGFDVLLDTNLRAWLLEVNTYCSFASSSPLDKRIKSELIADALTVAGIVPYNYDSVAKALRAAHSKRLQGLIPRSVPTRSHTLQTLPQAQLSDLGQAEWQLLVDAHDEHLRCGRLQRIFPTPATASKYSKYFSTPRYANLLLARWYACGGEQVFQEGSSVKLPEFVPKLRSRDNTAK